ncbi:hypothetical protein S2M10_36710 [Sphingomonas sp. S2M10]|jgi:hypothetical protein|uniref:hypothetical protein n=1 Tax=Sphingomonadales TaxID=204457 RepID=UPI00145634E6|nr:MULTISPECIES: hypothetical protein [Sphingomonadaceae]NLS28660.1 hypothetical protein [Sphingomonas sp. S2M10]
MNIISEACRRLEAKNARLFRVLQRASIAVSILFAAGVTGLVSLLWRAIVGQVHDPLLSAVLVGTIMLSLTAAAVMLLTFERRA